MSNFTKRRLSGEIDAPEPKRIMVGADMVPTVKTVFKKSYDSLYDNDEVPESDICIGYSLSLLLPNLIGGGEGNSLIKSSRKKYSVFMDIFSNDLMSPYSPYADKPLLQFYEAPFISSHSSFVCIHSPPYKFSDPVKTIYMWYHNPWGYDPDSSANSKLEKYLEPSIEAARKELVFRESRNDFCDLKSFEIIDNIELNVSRVYVRNIPGEYYDLIDTEPYTFRTIILGCITPTIKDKFDEIKSSSPFNGKPQNVVIDILILLKIIYNRDDIEILPNHLTMPGDGVQDKDDVDMDNILTKKIHDDLGGCSSWTFMYSRICVYMLRGDNSHEDILDIVTNKLPGTSLMGEHNVKFLLGKVLLLNGTGKSSYNTIRKIYEVIPEMEKTVNKQKKYQRLVSKKYDSALQKLFLNEECLKERSRRGICREFNPERESEKIPIIMDFIRAISNGRMKQDDEIEIRSGIIFGGYITCSNWDNLLDLLLIIVNCKHSMSGVRNIVEA